MQLRDKSNNYVMPNTTADKVAYDSNNTVAQKIAQIEGSGGGGSSKPLAGREVAFFGDSITAGINGANGQVAHPTFVELVAQKNGLAAAPNYGSSGANTQRLAEIMVGSNFRGGSGADYTEKDYASFDAVVIQIGTNCNPDGNIDADIPDISVYDIASSYPYEYSASDKTVQSATVNNAKEFFTECFGNSFYGNIALSIEYVRYKNPNCRIFITTIPPNIGFNGSPTLVNPALLNLAAKMGVQVIDAGAHAGLGLWNATYWSSDPGTAKAHFNVNGNEMWASYVAHELEKQFYETNLT